MRFVDLGTISYADAEARQMEAVEEVSAGGEPCVFLLEHEPVITMGRNRDDTHLHVAPDILASQGIALHKAARGGDITCHFPGQLVAYAVCRVDKRPGGVRCFVRDLEEVIIRTVAGFGIAGERIEGKTGVWVAGEKIASIGVGVRKWVTYHGLALNVGRDLTLFDHVTLCGLPGARPTSVHRVLGREDITMQEVKDGLEQAFRDVFADS